MPELPEVETMVRGIRGTVEGRLLVALRECPCPCRPIRIVPEFPALAERIQGQTCLRVHRLGKRAVLDFTSGDSLVIEPRMTGLLLVDEAPDVGHLRLEFVFQEGRQQHSVWFWDRRGLGQVRLYSADELVGLQQGGRLGRDALQLTEAEWRELCLRTRRPIKVALLDQALVAGIGNLYASEILHRSRIHPAQPAHTLTRQQIVRMSLATRTILDEAILHEGSTLGDGTYRNALNKDGGYQNCHQVYDRAEAACLSCQRGTIVRIVQAQRSTFYCPRCQRLPKGGGQQTTLTQGTTR